MNADSIPSRLFFYLDLIIQRMTDCDDDFKRRLDTVFFDPADVVPRHSDPLAEIFLSDVELTPAASQDIDYLPFFHGYDSTTEIRTCNGKVDAYRA